MDDFTWTFSRDAALLHIKRTPADGGYLLSIDGDGTPRSYFFDDPERLSAFQADFEKFLLGTGWLFKTFSPDRRSGRERRHFSRLMNDRRRWWTDGLREHTAPANSADVPEGRRRRVRRGER